MAKRNYNLQDIKDFMLEKLKLKWYGDIYDDEIGQYRPAEMKDFEIIRAWSFQCKDIKNPELGLFDIRLIVNLLDFRMPWTRGDCSHKWQEFLAQRHNQEQGLNK